MGEPAPDAGIDVSLAHLDVALAPAGGRWRVANDPAGARELVERLRVAPLNRDSGAFRGKGTVWGGPAQVRTTPYLAAMCAARFNPAIRAFHQRPVAAGEPKKAAQVACARKLLTILNAMARSGIPWQLDFQHSCERGAEADERCESSRLSAWRVLTRGGGTRLGG